MTRRFSLIIYAVCITGALGGLLFGLDQGFIANSLSTIQRIYHLDLAQGEHYASVLAWGGVAGVLLSGWLIRALGRKKVIVVSGFLFLMLSALSAILPPFSVLLWARAGLGFAVGIASFAVPLYLAETAPTSIRGSMATLFQLMITIGIFLIACSNIYVNRLLGHTPIALSLMFSVIAIFAFLMFVGSIFLPESPRWLVLKNKEKKALRIFKRMDYSANEIKKEMAEIKDSIVSSAGSGFAMLKKPFFWKVLLVGVLLQMFQQLVGINMMIYYAPRLFGYAHMTGVLALLAVPLVNMLFTFPAIYWIDRWGRKKLLYVGSVVMFLAMLVAGMAFSYVVPNVIPSELVQFTLLAAAIVYIFGFACSWGPVAWVLCSEMFPLKGREIGVTVTTMINWTFAGIVMNNALTFMKHYGNASIFFVFAGFCLLSLLFLRYFVPETKGISLEKIEQNLEHGKPIKDIGM